MSRLRRFFTVATVPVAACVLAGSALAYVCHPDSVGTRMLTLRGSVLSVQTHGGSFTLLVKAHGSCSHVVWNTTLGSSDSMLAPCLPAARSTSSTGALLTAVSAGRHFSVQRGSAQQPDVLTVRNGLGKLLAAFPLPARASTLAVSGGLAVISAQGQGVFALRLTDGLFGFLGPNGGAIQPQLDSHGVLFNDGESKLALRKGETVLRFLPESAIVQTIARTAKPLVTGGPIHAISMDGPRVAVAVGDTQGRCDRVLYWNVAWWPAQRVSAPAGPTCDVRPQGVAISSVAIGGFRAEWLVSQSGAARLMAGSPLCQEWVLGRFATPSIVTALTGDGQTLAFATTRNGHTSVSVVNAKYRPEQIASGTGAPMLAADGSRVAILWPDGRVDVRSRTGRLLATVDVGSSRGLALAGNMLTVLHGNRVEVFSVAAGKLLHTWRVPAGATGLDLQHGVAALVQGRNALVLDTATGRIAVIGHGRSPLLGVQIEGPGLAYAWSSGAKGVAQFVTTRTIDLALHLSIA